MRDVLPHLVLCEFLAECHLTNHRVLRAPYPIGVGIVLEDRCLKRLPETVVFLLRCLCHRSFAIMAVAKRSWTPCGAPTGTDPIQSAGARHRAPWTPSRSTALPGHYRCRLPMKPHPGGIRASP